MTNKQITLASRPNGFPKESDFRMIEASAPEVREGQILVRVIYLSLDPYMRGRMSAKKSYAPPVEIGAVMTGGAVGRVEQSRHPDFAAGEIVSGMFGWRQYAVSDGKGLFKVDPGLAPISTALGVLGMPGLTAYFGLLDIGKPKAGETVLVSGAAGAVGSYVGQIAEIIGCRVVGIAGADEKIDYLIGELGFDAAFNYKTITDYPAKLQELCPEGIDVYFDNVGGPITDAVFLTMNQGARIAICGQISQYKLEKPEMGPRLLSTLIIKRARVEGFLISDYFARFPEGMEKLTQWLREGKLKYRETVAEGIENAPAAFIGMLQGRNTGKQLVKISEP
ncbi:MAG: NADP-dependent oxidoreductase [Acidobacteriota bacterium]|nr:NADP-dependent oxidoreductase [Acidobacteriota bacterium]